MAKVIARVSGVALRPGISRNNRLYTREAIAKMVARAQERIESGQGLALIDRTKVKTEPLSQRTHHAADDDSTRIVGGIRKLTLDEDGAARFTADIADTPHARTIASLLDTTDDQPPFLRNVSIRAGWIGSIRSVPGKNGETVTTCDDIELDGLDYTASPGVPGAQVDSFEWVGTPPGPGETAGGRVLITESVQEAHLTAISEEAMPVAPVRFIAPTPEPVREQAPAVTPAPSGTAAGPPALPGLLMPPPHILENGTCVTCARVAEGGNAPGDGSKPYGDVQYADPGYQADKKKRYPVDTKAHVKSALSYLAQKSNAAKYTAAQLKRVMGRIKAAAKKFGITVSAESAGWTFDAPFQVSEAVAEHYGDPSCSGSWSVRASNGPVDICLSSYSVDPEDLDVILRAAADAACKALAALDPDMDGDVDVPGVGDGSDPDDDAPGETAPDVPTTPAASPAAATTETEEPAMAETTTPAETAAPGIDPKALAEAVAAVLDSRETAKAEKKAAKRQAREAAAAEAARTAQESAAAGQGIPATAGAAATETEDQRRARLKALVDEQFATAAKAEGLTAEKTDEQLVAEMIEERMVPLRQARAEGGGVQRKGIAQLEAIADSPTIGKQLQEASNEDLKYAAAAAFGPKGTRR